MLEEPLTTAELLEQWRDATRAAELAERLARMAEESVERSDRDAAAAQEIGRIAERAAKHAERTARIAREAADRATAFAKQNRSSSLADATQAVTTSRAEESAARQRYHDAELEARNRQLRDGSGL